MPTLLEITSIFTREQQNVYVSSAGTLKEHLKLWMVHPNSNLIQKMNTKAHDIISGKTSWR